VHAVRDAVEAFRNGQGESRQKWSPRALGIEFSGHLDESQGRVVFSPSLQWNDVDILSPLKSTLGLPVVIMNDVNALSLWEAMSPDRSPDFAVVLCGEGVGAAIVHDRQPLTGFSGGAGEVGHLTYPGSTVLCECKKVGCIETVASYGAIRRSAQMAGLPARLQHVAEIVDLAESDRPKKWQPEAIAILEEAANAVAFGVAALCNVTDPHLVIISSTAFSQSRTFQDALRTTVESTVFRTCRPQIEFFATSYRRVASGAAWAAIATWPRQTRRTNR
jgi:predicted NBD/HSP70 family sugar kinase